MAVQSGFRPIANPPHVGKNVRPPGGRRCPPVSVSRRAFLFAFVPAVRATQAVGRQGQAGRATKVGDCGIASGIADRCRNGPVCPAGEAKPSHFRSFRMKTKTANYWMTRLIWRGGEVWVLRTGGFKKKPPSLGSSWAVLFSAGGRFSTGDSNRFHKRKESITRAN